MRAPDAQFAVTVHSIAYNLGQYQSVGLVYDHRRSRMEFGTNDARYANDEFALAQGFDRLYDSLLSMMQPPATPSLPSFLNERSRPQVLI